MSMPQNKKHHYVPRFYLKRFTDNAQTINLYHLRTQRAILGASLRDQCHRDYFYGRDTPTEKSLAGIETEVSKLFAKITQFESLPPPFTPDHLTLLVYVLIQSGRTLYASDAVNESVDKMTKEALSDYFLEKEGIDLSKFRIGLEDPVNYALSRSTIMYPLLIDMHYKLLINQTDVEFITSDNPVVLYNQLFSFRSHGSSCGMASKGLQAFLPLDPRKLVVFYDGDVYRLGRQSIVTFLRKPQDIYELNALQMVSARDSVYFKGSS